MRPFAAMDAQLELMPGEIGLIKAMQR